MKNWKKALSTIGARNTDRPSEREITGFEDISPDLAVKRTHFLKDNLKCREPPHSVMATSIPFVYTKPGAFETGEGLSDILIRKEAERIANGNIFWWGVGNSLGVRLRETAETAGGTLPLLFLVPKKPTPAKSKDIRPIFEFHWTKWQSSDGRIIEIPPSIRVISRGDEDKKRHYALVCQSGEPLIFNPNGPVFDPQLCNTAPGGKKSPGTSQVTALVWGDPTAPNSTGAYRLAFRATLVHPWQAILVAYHLKRLG
jgi:hypothetical protein